MVLGDREKGEGRRKEKKWKREIGGKKKLREGGIIPHIRTIRVLQS
jgi:hypothetical protein